MPIICWGNLAKSASETTRIEQSMMGYVEAHDENPNAHMGPDYALGAHRLQTILDHAPYSILNKFTYPQARVYKCIVDPAGYGDQTDIQAAIDYVNGLGGGSVLIKAGTYTLSADLILYSNIALIGEDDDTTILDFANGNYNVQIEGTSGTHKRNILFNNFQITRSGKSGQAAVQMDFVDDILFERVYFKDNFKAGIGPNGDISAEQSVNRFNIKNCRSSGNFGFLNITGFNNCKISGCQIGAQGGGADLIILGSGTHLEIENNYFDNIVDRVIYSESSPYGVTIECNTIIGATTASGIPMIDFLDSSKIKIIANYIDARNKYNYIIYLLRTNYCSIVDNYLYNSTADGIYLSDSDYNIINSNHVLSCGGWGVNISDAASIKNGVVGNEVRNNVSGAIQDLGTNNEIAHNIIT